MMTRGRVHPLTVEEPTITMTVSGTYWQDYQTATTMIDSSVTHSFVARTFALCGEMVTEVTVNRMIYVTDVYQVTLLFLGIEFSTDLISSFTLLYKFVFKTLWVEDLFRGYSPSVHGSRLHADSMRQGNSLCSLTAENREWNYPTHELELGAQELSMRQTKWFGVVKGHDLEIHYHPDKANVVTETLSPVVALLVVFTFHSSFQVSSLTVVIVFIIARLLCERLRKFIFEVKVYRTQYRPLNRDMFIQLLRRTSIRASHIPATAFQRYCFDFIAYGALQSRVYEHTYLSDVIGYLREWSFVKQTGDTSRSNVRQIILSDESHTEINVSLWGNLATKLTDEHIRSLNDKKILDVISSCKVGLSRGVPALHTTCASDIYLNIPLNEMPILNTIVTERVRFKLKEDIVEETVLVTTIPDFYLKLQEGVEEGTRFCICGTIVDVDVKEWKYVRCSDCRKKAVLCEGRFYCGSCKKNTTNPREAYMLAVKVYDKNEFMTCVLFDVAATPLLGFTVDQLVKISLSEGAGNPAWISNLLYESLLGLHVVFGIKIDNYNLPPKFERRFTVTKYYDQQLKMDNIGNTNTDNVENIDNVITVPSAVSSPFASSSVVRAEQEIVDIMNVDGTAGNIKSVRSETLMFEGVAEVTDEEDNEVHVEKKKKAHSQSSMVEVNYGILIQSADNMEDLVCDKDKAEVDKSEHDCGKSGTKVTEMEVYQDVADNIEDHECYEDIIGGSNVEEDVSEKPVADMNEMQDTEIRDPVVIMSLHTSAYVLDAERDVLMAYGDERTGITAYSTFSCYGFERIWY
ncbi:hypothetical protein LXL04_019820 [Taraxacum kok-saghyz]